MTLQKMKKKKLMKRFLASLLSVCMMLTSLQLIVSADASAFTDVKTEDWFYDAVSYVKNEGLMNGISDTDFAPYDSTTRGMIVTILWRQSGSPAADGTQFDDVAPEQYYADAVLWAATNNIVLGYGDGLFGPDDVITREQLATILYRFLAGASDETESDYLAQFADADKIGDYAKDAFNWAISKGIITGMGDGTLAPQGQATRAQAAAILYRMMGSDGESNQEEATYTVTFQLNYDDEGTYQTATAKAGETVTEPTKPKRSGYSFTGWFNQAEGGEKFNFATPATEDITLYAQWKKITAAGGGGGAHSHHTVRGQATATEHILNVAAVVAL